MTDRRRSADRIARNPVFMLTLNRFHILLSFVFLVQACGTSNGLVTRPRYNDHYYIGMSKREKPGKNGKLRSAENKHPLVADPSSIAPPEPLHVSTGHNPETERNRPAACHTPHRPLSVEQVISTVSDPPTPGDRVHRNHKRMKYISSPKRTVSHPPAVVAQSTHEDELSLLWVIVVVIVVLWIVGLLAGGLGIGGVLNLLLIAALVLLILWLLRIL